MAIVPGRRMHLPLSAVDSAAFAPAVGAVHDLRDHGALLNTTWCPSTVAVDRRMRRRVEECAMALDGVLQWTPRV